MDRSTALSPHNVQRLPSPLDKLPGPCGACAVPLPPGLYAPHHFSILVPKLGVLCLLFPSPNPPFPEA